MSITAESRLASLAAGQWGMLTAAQASANGIARSTLVRREQAGTLERIRSGVYRLPGAPTDRLDDIRAAWLASDPAVIAHDRLDNPNVVVGGAAAAWAHQIGDLYPAPYLLYTAKRRQTAHDDVRYSSRSLPASDVMILDGLPVTTRERTIADLLHEGDLSLVADVLRDAESADNDLDVEALVHRLDSHAKRLGYSSGAGLYAELRTLAGVDAARLQELVESTDLTERLSGEISEQIMETLGPLFADMNAEIIAQLPDMLGPIRKQIADQADRILAPAMKGWTVPRVKLPDSALPKIVLPSSTQAVLRDLATRPVTLPPGMQQQLADLAERAAEAGSPRTAGENV